MNLRATRLIFALLALSALIALLNPTAISVGAKNERPVASNIRITPAAPVFDDKERVAELIQRRERVAQNIGPQSLLILFSAEPRIYSNSVDYPYRQENNLYYLTHLKQKGATLVLLPGNTKMREILFLPKRNALRETWDGRMYSPEEAYERSGIREIWQPSEFEPFIKALRNRQPYRPNPENILKSDLPAGTTLNNDHGFTTLFDAAAKERPDYLCLSRAVKGKAGSLDKNKGSPRNGPKRPRVLASGTSGPFSRKCVW